MHALALAILLSLTDAGHLAGDRYLGRELARPMSHLGASWLDRPGRDDVQRPRQVLDVLGVKAGQVVADVGCGSGYFTVPLARRVGPTGSVHASDVQPEMLAIVARRVKQEKLGNVVLVKATAASAGLPDGRFDLLLLVDVYHELADPPAALAQYKRALKPGGRLALVEYRAEDDSAAHIRPEHKMTLEQLRTELGANGWTVESVNESLPEQRIVVFVPAAT